MGVCWLISSSSAGTAGWADLGGRPRRGLGVGVVTGGCVGWWRGLRQRVGLRVVRWPASGAGGKVRILPVALVGSNAQQAPEGIAEGAPDAWVVQAHAPSEPDRAA